MSSTELITIEQVEDVLLHGGALDVVTTEAMQEDMVRRVLASESLADAFADFSTVSAESIEGTKVKVNGIAWVKSAYTDGSGVYALLKCTIPGEKDEVIVSMGGRVLMASFVYAMRREAMPIEGAFVKKRSRSNPENAYWTFNLA